MEAVAEWIDTNVIAEAIVETLEDEDSQPDIDTCKKVWLSFLGTELSDGLKGVCRYAIL